MGRPIGRHDLHPCPPIVEHRADRARHTDGVRGTPYEKLRIEGSAGRYIDHAVSRIGRAVHAEGATLMQRPTLYCASAGSSHRPDQRIGNISGGISTLTTTPE